MTTRRFHATGIIAVGMAAALLAACSSGSGSPSGSAGGSTADSGGKVQLRFAGWDESQTPAMQAFIDAFQAKNPNISVKYETVPFNQFGTKLQVQASTGDAPDVFWLAAGDRDLYASEGVTQNLDDLIKKSSFDTSAYDKASLSQVTYNGHLYGFPRGAATVQLWYNKAIFDGAGVAYPKNSWTWDDLKTNAQKLTDTAKGQYGVVALYDGTQSYYNTIFQAGGKIINDDGKSAGFDDPKTVQGLSFWTDLIKAGATPSYQKTVDTAPDAMFQSGKAAMIYAGSWYPGIFIKSDLKDKIDVVEMPAGPAGQKTLLGANAYSMASNSKHPDEAWKFLSYIAGPEGSKVGAQSKVVVQPAEMSAAKVWAAQFPQWTMANITDSAKFGVAGPTTKLTAEWTAKMKDALAPALDLKISPAEAAANADKAIETVLAKEKG